MFTQNIYRGMLLEISVSVKKKMDMLSMDSVVSITQLLGVPCQCIPFIAR